MADEEQQLKDTQTAFLNMFKPIADAAVAQVQAAQAGSSPPRVEATVVFPTWVKVAATVAGAIAAIAVVGSVMKGRRA